MRFIDEVVIQVASGAGGNGVVSFWREKFVPRGGPDGGDGGRGGDLVLEATRQRNTLVDFRRNKIYRADDGESGTGRQMYGAKGDDNVLWVPVGTVVFDEESGEPLADLAEEGARYVIPGGAGGLGNMRFATATNRTPLEATPGAAATETSLRLELRLLADVGLLGFPNAGKSTLISRISAAKPKIADYPFTTLVPNLGVVDAGDGRSFVVADIPGLIEGAADGAGLGLQFLRHVERCAFLLHLVAADAEEGVVERLEVLRRELSAYDEELFEKPQMVVLSKIDLLSAEERQAAISALEQHCSGPVWAVSAATNEGLDQLVRDAWRALCAMREAEAAADLDSEQT